MSDFVSDFWGWYVAVLTAVSILGCAVVLYVNSRAKSATAPSEDHAHDAMHAGQESTGAVATTGHIWDEDLAEYNNPLPRWWMWLFYLTIVFSVAYLVLYPGFGRAPGMLQWSSAKAYTEERSEVDSRIRPLYAKYTAMDLKAVAADPDARAMGERLFLNYCAQCHGSDARGGRGFPNLTHTRFMYGRDPEQIRTTITTGRAGVMPAFGSTLGEEKLAQAVAYVRTLSALPSDSLKAQLGRTVFMENCSGCHGGDGKGNIAIGAPDLTDSYWLYGSSLQTMLETVRQGRHTNLTPGLLAMPSFKDTLGEERIHVLAAYVWGLANPTVKTASR